VEGFSKELCGGTHVGNTAQIGLVKIVEERSIGGSMRRIEALAGKQAIAYINEKLEALKKAAALLKIKDTSAPQAIENLIAEKERLAREIKKAGKSDLKEKSGEALAAAEMIGEVALFAAAPEGLNVDELRAIFDDIKVKNKSFAAVLGSSVDGKANLITALSQDVADRGLDAGALVKEIAKMVKGGGGGSKLLAQAGGKDGSKIADAVKSGADIIRGKLS
jgi:alanyl-tRNA synthetase